MNNNKNGNMKYFLILLALIVLIIIVFICVKDRSDKNSPNADKTSAVVTFSTDNFASELTSDTSNTQPTTNSSVSSDILNTDFSCFDNCAFIGNSRLLALGNYDIADNVYAKVGLTVNSVFTDNCEGSSVHVIDELNGKSFDKIFVMFGDNECGWGSMTQFTSKYKNVIAEIKERVPGAKIYLISVLPISKSKSAENQYGYNKDAIDNVNVIIKQIATDEGLTYLDAASSVIGTDGYLPDAYSTDGCHLKKEYDMLWAKYIADNM